MLHTAEEAQLSQLLTALQKARSFPACLAAICRGQSQVFKSYKAMEKIATVVAAHKQLSFSVS